mmetsp:Transcript_851/g.1114  ORF Transcript_851/g.1114 Transcript_851/m.1114 type:complete len:144 (+) Transcript_851:22-453(+)
MTGKKRTETNETPEFDHYGSPTTKQLGESNQVFRSVPDFIKYKRSSSMKTLPKDEDDPSNDQHMHKYLSQLLGIDERDESQYEYPHSNHSHIPKGINQIEKNWAPKSKESTKRTPKAKRSSGTSKTKNKSRPQSARIRNNTRK